jgi:hypothetical protein
MEDMRSMEDFAKEEDYLDWRFAVEAHERSSDPNPSVRYRT